MPFIKELEKELEYKRMMVNAVNENIYSGATITTQKPYNQKYYYLHYYKDGKVHNDYLGKLTPDELKSLKKEISTHKKRRKALAKVKKQIEVIERILKYKNVITEIPEENEFRHTRNFVFMKYPVIEEFVNQIKKEYPEKVKNIILFGSIARNEERLSDDPDKNSDIDILIVWNGDKNEAEAVHDIQYQFMNKTRFFISPVILTLKEFNNMQLTRTPFWEEIDRDGIELL